MHSSEPSWSWGPADSRLVRFLLYVPYGLLGGLLGLMLVLLSYSLVESLMSGEITVLLVFIVVLVILLFGRAAILERSVRASFRESWMGEFYRAGRLRWYVVAAIVGGGAQLVVFDHSPAAWVIGFLGALIGSFSVAALLGSEGELHPESRTLTYGGRDIDLDLLTRVRRLRIGGRTILWLSYTSGRASATTPRLLVVPTRLIEEAWDVFETGIDQEAEHGETHRSTQVAYIGTGLGFFAITAGVFVLVRSAEGLVLHWSSPACSPPWDCSFSGWDCSVLTELAREIGT